MVDTIELSKFNDFLLSQLREDFAPSLKGLTDRITALTAHFSLFNSYLSQTHSDESASAQPEVSALAHIENMSAVVYS